MCNKMKLFFAVSLFFPSLHVAQGCVTSTDTSTVGTLIFGTVAPSPKSYEIVDTGVTDCSNDAEYIQCPSIGSSFYGQDAQYSGNQPSYRDNNDDTISDLVTGLMWSKYMWKFTISDAQAAVATSSLAGHTDWRLPTIKELYSLVLFSGDIDGMTAGTKRFIDTNYFDQPLGDTSSGEREIDAQTLSSNEYTGIVFGREKCNFGYNFIDGRQKCYTVTTDERYFRFVRGAITYGVNNFTDNGDGTISDGATGLMWQQSHSTIALDWEMALLYCENLITPLVLPSYSDWRLPNAKELHSIVDYERSPQHTDSPAINPIFNTTKIKNPDDSDNYPFFWTSTTLKEGSTPQYGVYIAFGEAVGMPDSTLLDVHGAGAQRSDPKSDRDDSVIYPTYHGPQGDLVRVYNYARCVRG